LSRKKKFVTDQLGTSGEGKKTKEMAKVDAAEPKTLHDDKTPEFHKRSITTQ